MKNRKELYTLCGFIDPASSKFDSIIDGKKKLGIDLPLNSKIIGIKEYNCIPMLIVSINPDEMQIERRILIINKINSVIDINNSELKYIGIFSVYKEQKIISVENSSSNVPEYTEYVFTLHEELKK